MILKNVKITQIVDVDKTQARADYSQSAIDEYADKYCDPGQYAMPPIELVPVPGEALYWIIDGHHRYKAAMQAGLCEIRAEVLSLGDRPIICNIEDALLYAAQRNKDHGLQRTNADKRRAVELILTLNTIDLGDVLVANSAGVSTRFVAKVRNELEEAGKITPKKAPKDKAAQAIADPKNAGKSNREIAEAAGVDEKTVRQVRKNGTFQKSAPDQEQEPTSERCWKAPTKEWPPANKWDENGRRMCANCGLEEAGDVTVVTSPVPGEKLLDRPYEYIFCCDKCRDEFGKKHKMIDVPAESEEDGKLDAAADAAKEWVAENAPASIADVPPADLDGFDPQTRPSKARVTADTKRVVPDVEKPKQYDKTREPNEYIKLTDPSDITAIVDDVIEYLGERVETFRVILNDTVENGAG